MGIIKKNKELILLIIMLFIIGICVELPSWIKGDYFVGGGDIKTQWYPFYVLNRRETIISIKNFSMPFYSWVLFLGNNIWSSKMTYGFVDIFNLLFYICKENYFWIYDVQIILKLLTAGITFYLFINYVFCNKKAAVFAGLLYASSSYLIYFSSQSGFQSFVSLAPLYLLGIVRCIKENKKLLFIISTSLLFLTNYYLFFSLTIFSPFIYLYSYYNIKKSFKDVIKNICLMILYYIIGFLISGVFTIPSFLYLLQNERVGNFNGDMFSYSNIKVYLNIICSMFSPNQLLIYGNNIYDFAEHTLKELCIFSSSLVVITFVYFFASRNDSFRKSSFLLLIIMIIALFVPKIGSILNGFSEVCFRWTYLYIAFEIFISSYVIFIEQSINCKLLITITICSAVVLLLSYFAGFMILSYKFNDYSYQFYIIVFVIVSMFLYSIFISSNMKNIYILLAVELIVYSVLFGIRCAPLSVSNKDINDVNSVLSDIGGETVKEHLQYIDDNEGEFFRTYVDYDGLYWTFSRNMNLLYNIEGVMSYDSTHEPSFKDMMDISEKGIVKDIYWEYSIEDPNLLDFVTCKYALTLNEEDIPFSEYEVIEPDYRGGIIISKNLNYKPFGITYTNRIDSTNSFNDLNKSIVINNKEIDKYLLSNKQNKMDDVYYYNNQLEGSVFSDDISFMVLKLSYDDGFVVNVNGNKVNTYKCNGGMIGFPIEKGENRIIVNFIPKGFKLGFCFTIIGAVLFVIMLFEKRITRLLKR